MPCRVVAGVCDTETVQKPTAAPPPVPGRGRRRARLLGWALTLALVVVGVVVLQGRWDSVREAGGLPGWAPSATAALAFLVANAVLAYTWRAVVALAGPRLAYWTAAWVWAVSQLARYTIGAAQVGGRAVAGRRYGLSATAGAVTTLVEIAWQTSLTAALLLGTLPWWLPGADGLDWLAVVGVAPVAVLVAGSVHPRGVLRAVGRVLAVPPLDRLAGGRLQGAAEAVRISRGDAARVTALFAANTSLRLVGFLTLFVAVGGDLRTAGLQAIGAHAAGHLVGRLAVFAPGGLGPREGATALVLAPAIGAGPAVVLVTATRLLEVVAELAFLAITRAGRPAAVSSVRGGR